MHVTIALLDEDPQNVTLYDEDEVFGDNQDKFSFVEQHFGDDADSDVSEILSWFGPAITDHGRVKIADRDSTWIDIDIRRLKPVFDTYWPKFQEAVGDLVKASSDDFATGRGDIEYIMQRLNETYNFDWLYVMDRYGSCRKVADWLRSIQGEGQKLIQRYYIIQTFDGGQ